MVKSIATEQPDELDPRDREDFAELVRRHHRDLLVYARSLTREGSAARDIVQDAFVVAFEKVETFDRTRDFATWMRGIVRNKWREWLRRNKRYHLSEDQLEVIDGDIAEWQAAHAAGRSSVFDALDVCLKRLPENLHEAIHAFYYEGKSGEEVSASLGLSPAAVRKRLERARRLLKKCVDDRLRIDPATSRPGLSPESST